jgi:hypothetical protein
MPCKYASNVAEGGRPERKFRTITQSFKENFMNLKVVIALCLFTAIPTIAYAQQNPPPAPPPPTIADVQKVVQAISADKAKVQIYCQLDKLYEQASAETDQKKQQALATQIEPLEQKLGPDYVKLEDSLSAVDPDSALGKQIQAAFAPLDKQCK